MILRENDVVAHEEHRYQVQGKIGSESSFGAVFKALNQDAVPVVIKQLLGKEQISRDLGLDYAYVCHTFQREARILMTHNHPQIVRGLDFFEYEGSYILVLEYINGQDLDQALIRKLENGQVFSQSEIVPIGVSICQAIHAIHQLPGQVLYRDLKPRNIMWDAQNQRIKIIDFGTARFMDRAKNPTQALGTPGYAPPEFYTTSEALSFAADVYTIGATLYELVTGEMPEPLLTPHDFHGYEAELHPDLRQIITKAMNQDPRKRYQTAGEMGSALSALEGSAAPAKLAINARNPYPYLSCVCPRCGALPKDNASLFCQSCGGKIHVLFLRIKPARPDATGIDLFLDKAENLIGRADMEEEIFPDIDLSRYDPDCYVSRRHCILRREGTSFLLEPLKTTNHTVVDGLPLRAGKGVPIAANCEIQLANLHMTFSVKPCLEASP